MYICVYIAILKLNALQLVYSPFQNILHSEGLATNEPTQQVGLQPTSLWSTFTVCELENNRIFGG